MEESESMKSNHEIIQVNSPDLKFNKMGFMKNKKNQQSSVVVVPDQMISTSKTERYENGDRELSFTVEKMDE